MPKLRSIVLDCVPVPETAIGETLYERFRGEPDTLAVAILRQDGRPVGLIERHSFTLKMAAEFGRALFARRPVSLLMDKDPLIVEAEADASEFMRRALNDRPSDLLRGFIVTEGGRYLGVGTPIVLLRMIGEENQRRADEMGALALRLAHANADADQARAFLGAVIEHMPAMVTVTRAADGVCLLANRSAKETLGLEEVAGARIYDLMTPEHSEFFALQDRALMESKAIQVSERDGVFGRGSAPMTIRTRKVAIAGEDDGSTAILTVAEDITEQKLAAARIERMAHRDALTDLPNRLAFRLELEAALRRRKRSDAKVGVLCIDLDNFKSVNDTLGHPAGDALLQAATERLTHCVRAGDMIARLGGDEFAVVQMGIAGPADAGRLAGRIVASMSEPFELAGHQIVIGASIGMAIAPSDGDDPDELLKKADMALYRTKSDGRNGFHFFEAGMDEALKARRVLEIDLRQALVEGAFELHYQPLFDLSRGVICCCEALIRWRHPRRGLVPPGDFIALAEETGIIVPLGEWVLRQACAEAARWPESVKLAVNISPVQFRSRNLVQVVISALASAGLPAHRLELEITENVLLNDTAGNIEMLHKLRECGVLIAMDDFGTGYSSLGYLRDFPFDKIKIDRSFVRDLHDRNAQSIVKAVTGLATALGIATTAEGVETIEQLEHLRGEGCDEVQGFLISKPRLPADLAELTGWPSPGAAARAA
ncbi:diguanylate cyclase/phosphodiesterase [Rhizobiales bacterium GAS188]|nr:diguanylate cyclase/phosphodiesterase [Rhizobiales bacterium GAS188]